MQEEGALCQCESLTVYGHHDTGKESLDINLLKAERLSAVPLPDHEFLKCDNNTAQEWVT